MSDRVISLVGLVVEHLRTAFNPGQLHPPLGGGTAHVRFFAGDTIPTAAWNAHSQSCGCGEPMLWVRVVRRWRTTQFPNEFVGAAPCGTPRAVTIEAGIMRCAITEPEPAWDDYEQEAMVAVDDSWRLDAALKRAMQCAETEHVANQTALAAGEPFGPEGGILAWAQHAHAELGG